MDSTQTGGNVHWCRWPHRLSISTLLGSKIFGVLHVFFQSSARTRCFPAFTGSLQARMLHLIVWRVIRAYPCICWWCPCPEQSSLVLWFVMWFTENASLFLVAVVGSEWLQNDWCFHLPSSFACTSFSMSTGNWMGEHLFTAPHAFEKQCQQFGFLFKGRRKSSKTSMNANVLKQDPSTSSHTLCVVILNKYEC